jgi:hypothetical protein
MGRVKHVFRQIALGSKNCLSGRETTAINRLSLCTARMEASEVLLRTLVLLRTVSVDGLNRNLAIGQRCSGYQHSVHLQTALRDSKIILRNEFSDTFNGFAKYS